VGSATARSNGIPIILHATSGTGAVLYALELPPEGGQPCWVDLRAAYAGLPDELKRAVEGRHGIFDYTKRLAGYQEDDRTISEEARRKTRRLAIRWSTPTGDRRPGVYLDSTTTVESRDWDATTGAALLDDIYRAATRPGTSTHTWQIGDLLLWDNGFTMHRASRSIPPHAV